jgi:DNA-binding IclR family transcriptional regulator
MTLAPPADDAGDPAARAQRGIQSVEVGGQLLRALADLGRPQPLKALAAAAGMSPAKAHPYLVSYGKLGLIAQDRTSGHYGLGPLARQLGLIGLQQVDPVRLASDRLPALAQAIGHTVAVAVEGNLGPTIVRIEQGPGAIVVNMRHGTVVSREGTASGRLFGAFGPPARQRESGLDAATAARIRADGVAVARDGTVEGISAAAAAVFDATGVLVLGLTAIGPTAAFDARRGGAVWTALADTAQELSRALGAPATAGTGPA